MPTLDETAARALLGSAPVAGLATIRRTDGTPRLVPITFTMLDDLVVSAVDDVKPKRHRRLARLRDIESDPRVGLLADHYDDDWSQLWWVRLDATAQVHDAGDLRDRAIAALVQKYPPYQRQPPEGPVMALHPTRWSGWSAR